MKKQSQNKGTKAQGHKGTKAAPIDCIGMPYGKDRRQMTVPINGIGMP